MPSTSRSLNLKSIPFLVDENAVTHCAYEAGCELGLAKALQNVGLAHRGIADDEQLYYWSVRMAHT